MRMHVAPTKTNNTTVHLGVNKGLHELSSCWENFEYLGRLESFLERCTSSSFCNLRTNSPSTAVTAMAGNQTQPI